MNRFILICVAVFVGTTIGGASLHAQTAIQTDGSLETNSQLISTVTGEPPLAVSSSTLVENLNADRVDGIEGADLMAAIALLQQENLALRRCATVWRYADMGDGTVLDCHTGIFWLRDASCALLGPNGDGSGDWQEALDAAAALADGACGLTDGSQAGDWRQPSILDLCSAPEPLINFGGECSLLAADLSLVNVALGSAPRVSDARGQLQWSEGDPFVGVQSAAYWSGDDFLLAATDAWSIDLDDGVVDTPLKTEVYYIWPVRDLE